MAKAATMHRIVITRSVFGKDGSGERRISTRRSGGAARRAWGRRRRFMGGRRSGSAAWARVTGDVGAVPGSPHQQRQQDNRRGHNGCNDFPACLFFPIPILHARVLQWRRKTPACYRGSELFWPELGQATTVPAVVSRPAVGAFSGRASRHRIWRSPWRIPDRATPRRIASSTSRILGRQDFRGSREWFCPRRH